MPSQLEFSINGRFLTQPLTGVQRCARTLLKYFVQKVPAVKLITPPNISDYSDKTIHQIQYGPFTGHVWEQVTLPYNCSGPLLNLCNTAPLMKKNQVVCLHDANIYEYPDSYKPHYRALHFVIQKSFVVNKLKITTVSNFSARKLSEHLGIKLGNIDVIYNGYEHALLWDSNLASTSTQSIVSSYAHNGRKYILAVGSSAPHKNISVLLRLIDKLDNINIDLVVIGKNLDIFSKGSSNKYKNLFYMSGLGDNDLSLMMKNALCLVFPSITEGFGLPIIEAMYSKCPVISSNTASMPEVCGSAALLASPFDPEDWLNHIKSLDNSSNLVSELRESGLIQAKKFSWSDASAAYTDLMDGLS